MYRYRLAVPTDLYWMDQAVAAAAWESLSPEEQSGAWLSGVAARAGQRMRMALADPGSIGLIAQAGPILVGMAVGVPSADATTDEPQGLLLELWVSPPHRRRGVGSTLYRLTEAAFMSRGLRKIKVLTGVHSPAGLRLAARFGYQPEGLIGAKLL